MIEETEEEAKDCPIATKPTEPQPGGSPLGKWACDTKTGTWFWDDPQVAE